MLWIIVIYAAVFFVAGILLYWRRVSKRRNHRFIKRKPIRTRSKQLKHLTIEDRKVIAKVIGLKDWRRLVWNGSKHKLSYNGKVYASGREQVAKLKIRAYYAMAERMKKKG